MSAMSVLRPTADHSLLPGRVVFHGTRGSGFRMPRGPAWFAYSIGVGAYFASISPGRGRPKAMRFEVAKAPRRMLVTNYAMDVLDTARMLRSGTVDWDYTDPFSGPGGFRKAETWLCEQGWVDGVIFLEGDSAEIMLCDPAQWLVFDAVRLVKKSEIDY